MKPDSAQIERPPIVVVMGHVDHGKSTLLDYIRKANTVAKEAGGITQHVAAYEVVREHEGREKRITFIDTPGHAAFQQIRARGANVADIAVLVVAADDGVKAQTLEALESIRAAGIPFVVAINKIDKPNADLSRTEGSLLEHGVYLEKLGGDVPWTAISAKQGTGVDELLDVILLVAELAELRADPAAPGEGFVIEAHRDPKRGCAATLIVRNGTLREGEAVLAGRSVSPIRIMEDHAGHSLKEASFSTPVSLIGFDTLPQVGSSFRSYETKKAAEAARAEMPPEHSAVRETEAEGEKFFLPIIVRADTQGSLEAIEHEVGRIGDEYAGVRIVQEGIGQVSEDDTKAAVASKGPPAVVVGFNVATDAIAREHARQHGLLIESFSIIYKMTERLGELLEERRPKREVERILGRARILKLFSRRKELHLLGGSVFEGYLESGGKARLKRKGAEIGVGEIGTIQTNRQSVSRAEEGNEFGAEVLLDAELAPGDIIECFETHEE